MLYVSWAYYIDPSKTYLKSNKGAGSTVRHERFRAFCITLAQKLWIAEVRLRKHILGETTHGVKPLSDTRAIQNGANALAEGFLFSVAAGLIIAETWRQSRGTAKRRDELDDRIEDLQSSVSELRHAVEQMAAQNEERSAEANQRNNELNRILTRVVEIGLRGGWAVLDDESIKVPKPSNARATLEHIVAQERQENSTRSQ